MIGASGTPMRSFPPGRRGVLLPLDDRRAASAGISMYTVSKRWVLFAQKLAFWFVRIFGARLLPGRTVSWSPPCSESDWIELVAQWEGSLGQIRAFSAYQRPQSSRTGLTFVVIRENGSAVVIKLRDQPGTLMTEVKALMELGRVSTEHFQAPKAISSGQHNELFWTAQQCVFDQPHVPVFDVDDELFDEVSRALKPLFPKSTGGKMVKGDAISAPAHADLTPWNLRRDRRGQVWLFDWEDVRLAPLGSDRTYFRVTSAALTGEHLTVDLPVQAIDFWKNVVQRRRVREPEDAVLSETILNLLERVKPAGHDAK